MDVWRELHPVFAEDLLSEASLARAIEDKDVVGGTAPARVRSEIVRVRGLIGK